ncbi:NAD(P)/FAD-dependent oxidoreductase [Deltaproteobacteria bacterium]|nr:NAD(P)/FAD-dependent oxidoreductase [Deltaproteobacteria bacterium]
MDGETRFKKLLEPGYIGKVRIKNRMIKTGTYLGTEDDKGGYMNDKSVYIYERLARGGVGLVTHSVAFIDIPMGSVPGDIAGFRIDDDKFIPSFQKLTDAIHKHDCPAFIQMWHAGPVHATFLTGLQPVASSALTKEEMPMPRLTPARALTIPEIKRVVDEFAGGAARARKAGFDGIELNAGTTHLLNSFLSRAWNKRDDEYGIDSMENRARIVVEIIQEVKRQAGEDFGLTVILCGAEYGLVKGTSPEEAREFAKIFEAAGADALHVRAEYYRRPYVRGERESVHFPDVVFYPELDVPTVPEGIDANNHGVGGWAPLAAGIKKVVNIPVITIGRMDADIGEAILERGEADFIALNRRLLADPDYPNKIASGDLDDIRPCTACMHCFCNVEVGNLVHCRINAALGMAAAGDEKAFEIPPAEKKKKVMIVGAGPAGMEAARIAATRGHVVMLYDKQTKLGGCLPIAATVKGFHREDIPLITKWFKGQLSKLGVDVHLGKDVTPSLVKEIKPDVLILATGGIHDIPDIPGMDRRNVVTSEDLHHQLKFFSKFAGPRLLRWLTKFYMPIGKKVVVIGARMHGCQTAEFLTKRGRKVTIVDTGSDEILGEGVVQPLLRPALINWLDEKGVTFITGVNYEEITDKGLTITTADGEKQTIEADSIATALPLKPDTSLVKSFEGSAEEIYAIGDCDDPNLILNAVESGYRTALNV